MVQFKWICLVLSTSGIWLAHSGEAAAQFNSRLSQRTWPAGALGALNRHHRIAGAFFSDGYHKRTPGPNVGYYNPYSAHNSDLRSLAGPQAYPQSYGYSTIYPAQPAPSSQTPDAHQLFHSDSSRKDFPNRDPRPNSTPDTPQDDRPEQESLNNLPPQQLPLPADLPGDKEDKSGDGRSVDDELEGFFSSSNMQSQRTSRSSGTRSVLETTRK